MLMSKVIGHRGVASLTPENTLAGIRKAAELGLEWVELDVTLLGDDQAVIFHDGRLNRTTNLTGHIKSYDLKDVQKADAGQWFSQAYLGETVPTLLEALDLMKELNLGLNLELKVNRCNTQKLAYIAANSLKKIRFPDEKLLVSSFNLKALRHFNSVHPAKIGCLFSYLPMNWSAKARQLKANAVHVDGSKLTEKKAREIKKEGYELYSYTVNEPAAAQRLLNWGVDGFFTDFPQRFENLYTQRIWSCYKAANERIP